MTTKESAVEFQNTLDQTQPAVVLDDARKKAILGSLQKDLRKAKRTMKPALLVMEKYTNFAQYASGIVQLHKEKDSAMLLLRKQDDYRVLRELYDEIRTAFMAKQKVELEGNVTFNRSTEVRDAYLVLKKALDEVHENALSQINKEIDGLAAKITAVSGYEAMLADMDEYHQSVVEQYIKLDKESDN